MDSVQNRLIGLLQEIHDTCEQLNIKYILGEVTAEEAALFGKLTPGRYTATVYMTLKDFAEFRKYVSNQGIENRVIEGLNNNSRMPGFFFKYVDTTSTYYDYNSGNTYKYNGIYVKIEILRKYRAGKKARRLRDKERAFDNNSFKYRRVLSFKSIMAKWAMGIRLLFARKAIAKKLYKQCYDAYMDNSVFSANYMLFNRRKTKLVKYPSYLLNGRVLANLEGHSFYVPQNIECHTEITASRGVMDKLPEIINNSSVIVSDIISYEEYLTDMKYRVKTATLRERIWHSDISHGFVTYFVRKDWKIMLCVNERLDLMQRYAPIKKDLIAVYSKGDFDKVSELLADYDEQLKYHFAKTGMTIYFDKEIFDIYVAWLAHRGISANKIIKSIPKEWKNSRV